MPCARFAGCIFSRRKREGGAIRTGAQYRDSIRGGREIWADGEKVKDATTHPMFKPLVDARACMYGMQHKEATRDLLSFNEGNGERNAIANKLPPTRKIGGTSAAQRIASWKTSAELSRVLAMKRWTRCGHLFAGLSL